MVTTHFSFDEILGKVGEPSSCSSNVPVVPIMESVEKLKPGKEIPNLYTTKEVAEALRVSEKTVRNLRKNGLVPFRVGSRFRYHPNDVRAFLEKSSIDSDVIVSSHPSDTMIPFPDFRTKQTICKEKIK